MQNTLNKLEQQLEDCQAQLDTARKELRARDNRLPGNIDDLTTVLNGFTEPFFILAPDSTIQTLNRAALDYCHNEYQKVVGQSCNIICGQETSCCNKCPVINATQLGKKMSYERKGARGPGLRELIRVNPLLDADHKLRGAIVRIKDITEKRKTNEQLVLADRLTSLNQLSSGIAHEIRNPLAGITLFVDILADTERFDRTDQELDILTEIKDSCRKLGNIVTRVLDFAKPVTFARKAISVNQLIKRSVKLCSAKMNKVNVVVELDLAKELPDVKGETVELEQVLNNLIINSIDAMPRGGQIFIKTSVTESSFHRGRTVVKTNIYDTGNGIIPDLEDKIFNPFFSTKTTGTGLGLTIAHRIISRHGGILYRNSAKDQGTEFVFELPVISQDSSKEAYIE